MQQRRIGHSRLFRSDKEVRNKFSSTELVGGTISSTVTHVATV